MTKISSIDLYKIKEECLELQKKNNKLIIKGNSPILLTATILREKTESVSDNYEMFKTSKTAAKNSINNSYLDALIMYLHKNSGINGIINYLPVADDVISIAKQLSISGKYSDREMINFILENNIHALLNLKVGDTTFEEPISIAEEISSYSFMGLTGISTELSKMLKDNNLGNHMMFGWSMDDQEFKKLGYDYIDGATAYNSSLCIGKIKGKQLPKEKIWPRIIELSFAQEDDTYNLERIGGVLIDYFNWIEKELEKKGTASAMSPMPLKTYKK